jgi:hypothetical protein
MRQEPISVDDIIERRKRENPKLRTTSLKRKRDDDAVENDQDNITEPSESLGADGEGTTQFDESEEEGVPAYCPIIVFAELHLW